MSLHLQSETKLLYDDPDEILDLSNDEILEWSKRHTEGRVPDLFKYLIEIRTVREEWWVRFLAYCNRQ